MSALDRVRKKFGNLQSGTDKTDRSPSVSSVSCELEESEKFLPADLEHRIRAMAQRWKFSPAELAETLDLARADPAAWTKAVALDERREAEFRERGMLPRDA